MDGWMNAEADGISVEQTLLLGLAILLLLLLLSHPYVVNCGLLGKTGPSPAEPTEPNEARGKKLGRSRLSALCFYI